MKILIMHNTGDGWTILTNRRNAVQKFARADSTLFLCTPLRSCKLKWINHAAAQPCDLSLGKLEDRSFA